MGLKCSWCGERYRRFAVFAGPRTDVSEAWWERNCPENVKPVNSIQEFVDELVSVPFRESFFKALPTLMPEDFPGAVHLVHCIEAGLCHFVAALKIAVSVLMDKAHIIKYTQEWFSIQKPCLSRLDLPVCGRGISL